MYTGENGQRIHKCAQSQKFGDQNDVILIRLHYICLFLSISSETSFKESHQGRNAVQNGIVQRWQRRWF